MKKVVHLPLKREGRKCCSCIAHRYVVLFQCKEIVLNGDQVNQPLSTAEVTEAIRRIIELLAKQ